MQAYFPSHPLINGIMKWGKQIYRMPRMWCELNFRKVLHMMKRLELFVCFAKVSSEFATGRCWDDVWKGKLDFSNPHLLYKLHLAGVNAFKI